MKQFVSVCRAFPFTSSMSITYNMLSGAQLQGAEKEDGQVYPVAHHFQDKGDSVKVYLYILRNILAIC